MLRINLLPPYIYDKQKKIKWIVGSAAMFAATLVGLLWYNQKLTDQLTEVKKQQEDAQTQQNAYNRYVDDIKKEQQAVATTKSKQEFVANAAKYNDAWPNTYSRMRDLTSPRILLKSMNIGADRKSLTFTGFSQYEEDLVRWWMFLRAQSDFTAVQLQLPRHPWPPKDTNQGGGAGGFGSSPGSFGPRGGGGGGSFGGSTPAGFGPAIGGGGSFGGGRRGAAGFGGGGGNNDTVGEEEIEGRKGIKFIATAQLKDALAGGIATPTWGSATAAAGGATSGRPLGAPSGPAGNSGGSSGPAAGGKGNRKGGEE